ncbi:HNH endonuclease [Streptomyces sp. NBC_01591]|uniref:HNH endonuclease n=1 Tax=Streptomyces sp. NBC_01591 TaxID=2975888 RepID=UPI002DD83469|nr:HNH endonuclease [Streptomyces sp. NBC_01591]WSD73143.1 HNH endonuclease [Streptomyces sp. NBC_01591]
MRNRLHEDHLVYRPDGGSDDRSNLRLVHADCHRIHHARDYKRPQKDLQRTSGAVCLSRMR